jgi:hypothetical protein
VTERPLVTAANGTLMARPVTVLSARDPEGGLFEIGMRAACGGRTLDPYAAQGA